MLRDARALSKARRCYMVQCCATLTTKAGNKHPEYLHKFADQTSVLYTCAQ